MLKYKKNIWIYAILIGYFLITCAPTCLTCSCLNNPANGVNIKVWTTVDSNEYEVCYTGRII